VGLTVFPPYIQPSAGEPGLRSELLDLMNSFQSQYRFVGMATGPMRRFRDFDAGLYDLTLYDNLAWGWQDRPVEASKVYLRGGEVYVALAVPGRDQGFFAELKGKRMIGMRGYHYGFAGFKADPAYLEREFDMVLTQDNEATLRLLLAGRGDVAVVTEAYLNIYLHQRPEIRAELLISQRKDQEYAHSAIMRKGKRPSVAELDQLFGRMRESGVLQPLWAKYGETAPLR
jgi:polar amino acid transport system substrate-binding protein